METCQYCRISGRPTSRIRAEIQANCVKNRSGACAACAKLASIDGKIEEARRVLNRLLDEREELARTLNDHHDPFTNRLPSEIATNIFLHCQPPRPDPLDAYFTYSRKSSLSSLLSSVLRPGRVCERWRYISQNSPRLWSVLCVTANDPKTCIRAIERAQYWLQRSAGTPVYVDISVKAVAATTRPFVLKLFSVLATAAHRWETLHLIISPSLIQCFSDALSDRHLHLLDGFKLNCFGTSDDGVLRLNASPRVFINEDGGIPVIIGMERLIHFERGAMDPLDLDGYIQLMNSAQHLSSCTISSPEGHRPPGPLVEAPSLLSLTTRDIHGAFWDHFSFPKLQALYLYQHTAWRGLHSLLQRSRCPITRLQLDIQTESVQTIVGLFEHLPRLEDLTLLIESPSTPNLFFLLDSLATNTPTTFSKLKSLSCTVYNGLFDWNPLLVFLTNMTSPKESSLQCFIFDYDARDDDANWNDDNGLSPMDPHMLRLAADVTRNLAEARIYNIEGDDVLKRYRQGITA